MIYEYTKILTVAADGTGTFYLGTKIRGYVIAIRYVPGTLDTGADLTITGETTGVAVLTKANAGTSTAWFHPAASAHAVADGSELTGTRTRVYLHDERLQVAIAQGGVSTTGTITVWVDEPN